jgi:RNA polymerase primary sigma factor
MSPTAAQPKASPEILLVATAAGEEVVVKAKAKKAPPKAKATTPKSTAPKATADKGSAVKATKAKPAPKAKAAPKAKPVANAGVVPANPAAAADLADAALTEHDETDKPDKDEKAAKALASIKVGPKGVYTEDSIRVYLQEIGRIRLLRPDEEIELARKIADLLQLEELAAQFEADHGHHPDNKEWAALVDMPLIKFRRRLMLGRRAKEKMVQSNLRLVVSIAKKYMNRGLSFQDLIQEGSLGLIRAAEKFDHEKGYKFSARRSPAPSPTSRAPFACRCTSTRPSRESKRPPRPSPRNSAVSPPRKRSPNRWR